ncbi:halocyanin domain-containing protein [Halobium salinum]|uniref:Halocyanin domain-containing protein n=1 Tax=Halobium salinum TaxID=1364940 RepID=A0ABD5PGG1_9EURY|nr:halocyanin domain-containing protein [Halobium salinum]
MSPRFDTQTLSRRTYLQAAGLLGLAAVTPLAGCIDGGIARDPIVPPHIVAFPGAPDYGTWFTDVSNYRDTTWDFTGETTVVVQVGADGNGGSYGFGPAAIAVAPGTTVRWEWTGRGGGHDVVATDGSFASEYLSGSDKVFSHTFETPGLYTYVCRPHATMGMKGAVFVVGDGDGADGADTDGGGPGEDGNTGSDTGTAHHQH